MQKWREEGTGAVYSKLLGLLANAEPEKLDRHKKKKARAAEAAAAGTQLGSNAFRKDSAVQRSEKAEGGRAVNRSGKAGHTDAVRLAQPTAASAEKAEDDPVQQPRAVIDHFSQHFDRCSRPNIASIRLIQSCVMNIYQCWMLCTGRDGD